MIIVTPRLMVGNPEDVVWFDGTIWADTAEQAEEIILNNGTALIAHDADWLAKATQVLRDFGASEDWIGSVIKFALTGQT